MAQRPWSASCTTAMRSRSAVNCTSNAPDWSSVTHTSPLHAPSCLISQPVPASKASLVRSMSVTITMRSSVGVTPRRPSQASPVATQSASFTQPRANASYDRPETSATSRVLAGSRSGVGVDLGQNLADDLGGLVRRELVAALRFGHLARERLHRRRAADEDVPKGVGACVGIVERLDRFGDVLGI